MTNKDLHRKYQRETGKYSPCTIEGFILPDIKNYINWLEEKYIDLCNKQTKLLERKLSELLNRDIKIESE